MYTKLTKVISLLLVVVMLFSNAVTVFAAELPSVTATDAGTIGIAASNVTLTSTDSEQETDILFYIDKNAQISSLTVEVYLEDDEDNVIDNTVELGVFESAVSGFLGESNLTASFMSAKGGYAAYNQELDRYVVFSIPVKIAANAKGVFNVKFEVTAFADALGGNYTLSNTSVNSTITVKEAAPAPSSDYSIYYELKDNKADADGDKYAEYEVGETVTAEVFIVSNKEDITLQAYDIYLSHDSNLSYQSQNLTSGKEFVGDDGKLTHIQAVGEDSNTKNPISIPLTKGEAKSLGTITFKAESSAVYGTQMPITLTVGESGNTITNIGVGTTSSGDPASYYPQNTGTDLGAEVVTTYTVTYVDGVEGEETAVPADQSKQHNIDLTLSSTKPSRTGYTFTGWLGSDGTTYQAGAAYTGNADLTLTAQWDKNTVTVTWNGLSGVIYSAEINEGDTAAFDNTNYDEPSKEADAQYTYEFKGWTNTENPALNAEVIDLTTYQITETTNFYPVFSATVNTYDVIWYAQDGSSTLEKDNAVEYGTNPSFDSEDPVKASDAQYDYTFAGWATSANQETGTLEENLPVVSGATEYFAAFSKTLRSYKVTFNTEHGTAPAEQPVVYGNKASNPGVLTDTHYTFDGWYTDETYETEYDFNTMTIEDDTVIYAKWTAKTYTVTFYSNGGSGSMAPQEFTYGVAQALTANGFTAPTGKDFQNWNTNADGSGTIYGAGQEITLNANLTLYAQWTDASYDVAIKEGIQNGTVTADKQKANYEDEVTLTITPAEGYELDKLTVTDASGNEVPVSDNKFKMPDSDVEVNATFKLATYTVNIADGITNGTVSADPTSGNMNTPITLTVEPGTGYKVKSVSYTKEGETTAVPVVETDGTYSFNLPAANVTVTAEFEEISYTIHFDGNNATSGSINDIAGVKYSAEQALTTNSFTRNGYKFLGWSTDPNATTATYVDGASVKNLTTNDGETVTLYAIWDEDTFAITLNTNDGTINSGNVTEYTFGTGATLPTDVTKTGHDFGGWFDNAELTGTAVTEIGTEEYGAKKFWAKWTPSEYTIEYDSNGGSEVEDDSYTYGEGLDMLPTPTKPGYDFDGWYDENNNKVQGITAEDYGNKELTAKWAVVTYTITFNTDGGNEIADMSYDITKTVTLPTPTKAYYVFKGWKLTENHGKWTAGTYNVTNTDGTTAEYKEMYGIKDQKMQLVAQWERMTTPVVEEYKYAADGFWMIRVDAGALTDTREYQFNNQSMYYMEKQADGSTDSYMIENGTAVFYTLIPVAENGVTYIDTANSKLTDEGYNKLSIADCTTRSTITYDGRINDDEVINIADANIVYQMTLYGGKYYGSLTTEQRLAADMDKAAAEKRASIADVNKIVNIINGVN